MIFFDTTKTGAGHRSGLNRVSERLRAELGAAVTPVRWGEWDQVAGPDDWFVTGELFAAAERPGFSDFLAARRCRTAAIFHDAIPLRFPHITWPRSVARHPAYMKLLASFDRIWAVSATSRTDLLGFWHWQGLTAVPSVDLLALGADFRAGNRVLAGPSQQPKRPSFLCVGILEPRKNQALLLQAFAELWREGVRFDLHIVGRVNPHFGGPILDRLKLLRREFSALRYHEAAGHRLPHDRRRLRAAAARVALAGRALYLQRPAGPARKRRRRRLPAGEDRRPGGVEGGAQAHPDRRHAARPPADPGADAPAAHVGRCGFGPAGRACAYSRLRAYAIASPILSSCSSVCIAEMAVRIRSLPTGTAGAMDMTVKTPFSSSAFQKV